MLKIIFDNIIFSLQKTGGISVVWKELLIRLLPSYDYMCLFYQKHAENISCREFDLSDVRNHILNNKFLFITRYLPLQLLNLRSPFIFHSSYYRYSSNKYAINITTVHDFTYEYYMKGLKTTIHSWQKFKAIRHSDYIVCISENTKKDLLHFLPDIDPKKIEVIYNGVSDDYFPTTDYSHYKEMGEYMVFVGSRATYKNFLYAVEAIATSTYKLVIVGDLLSSKENEYCLLKLGQKRFICVGRVSNENLNLIYNSACALLYPSFYEGFGIPVLEAQKAGCPVIAYGASSIPEIIGDTPLLLRELSISEFKRCCQILKDSTQRANIVARGIKNAQRFTWDKMYLQYLSLYKKVSVNK